MKFYAAAAIILASAAPTAAQIGSWDITYNGTETNFEKEATDEITVSYLITSGRNATIEAYATDCSTPIDASVLTTFTTGLTPGSPDDELSIVLDIDKSAITSSNIWDTTDELIEFCVKVELLSEAGSVIKFENKPISVSIDTEIEYTAENDVTVSSPNASPGTGTAVATVDTYVSACKCNVNLECDSNPSISSSDTLSVCVKSSSDDVELMDLTSLNLLQAVTNEDMSVVLNNEVVESDLSTIIPGKTTRYIETIVPTRFFQVAQAITVSGVIEVQLKGTTRRILSVNFDSDSDARSTRNMRSSVAVARPGLFDYDDKEEEDIASSDFGFDVGVVALENDAEEVSASSGNVNFVVASFVAVVAVALAFVSLEL